MMANLVTIGTQLAPNWVANGFAMATQFISTMAKNGFSTGNNWLTKPRFQYLAKQTLSLYTYAIQQ